MIHTFADHARQQLTEQKLAIIDSLAAGSAKTMDEYRRMTGTIDGLNYASHVLDELVRAADIADGE